MNKFFIVLLLLLVGCDINNSQPPQEVKNSLHDYGNGVYSIDTYVGLDKDIIFMNVSNFIKDHPNLKLISVCEIHCGGYSHPRGLLLVTEQK